MYVAAGIMGVAAVAATLLRPVNERFMVLDTPEKLQGQVLPLAYSGNVYVVAVDGSDSSYSAFSWALSQVQPGVDTLIPFAVLEDTKMDDAAKLLHRYVESAKAKQVKVRPMFCPTTAVGAALTQVCRQLKPHALILGRNPNHTELAAYLSRFSTAPLTVFVSATDTLSLNRFDDVPVSSINWNQMDNHHETEKPDDPAKFLRDPFSPTDKVFEAMKKK